VSGVSHPADISVGPNQHGSGSSHRAKYRKLPLTNTVGIDQLDPIRPRSLGPGQAALAPRDVPHAYRVESEEARWLVITTPAGFDAFVREVAAPAPAEELPPAGRPFDPAVLGQAAAKVGIEILGAPGTLPA
jgi:hypothetical protein